MITANTFRMYTCAKMQLIHTTNHVDDDNSYVELTGYSNSVNSGKQKNTRSHTKKKNYMCTKGNRIKRRHVKEANQLVRGKQVHLLLLVFSSFLSLVFCFVHYLFG